MKMDVTEPYLRVIDLKQYLYCPRVLYYQLILPQVRPTTYKMEEGVLVHTTAVAHEKRRQLRTYGITHGERHFDVPVHSAELGLTGKIDLLIQTADEWIPVDYKNSTKVAPHYKMQVLAYGRLLAEDAGAKAIKRGFIYLIPQRTAVEIPFTPTLHRQFNQALQQIHTIYTQETMPPPTPQRPKCTDCEFRRFCNDVL
jgi:CRISPR-associated exonuclease Cas4